MFTRRAAAVAGLSARAIQTSAPSQYQVTVLGAAGGIGQPLSLLLKLRSRVTKLNLYDLNHTKGVASDLSHIDTNTKVQGFVGNDELAAALTGSDVVVIPAGVPRKPGMTRDDLFNTNATIVQTLVDAVGKHAPKAIIAIISNPVNSTVPIAVEALKKLGVYDPRKVLGVTTLDVVRARTFIGAVKNLDPSKISVPVIGGHAGGTILPLLSQVKPALSFTDDEREKLTRRIQNGGTEVVEAKAGTGSATLSMAHAADQFVYSILRGLSGEANVIECAYVESTVTKAKFFATPVVLGKNGAETNLGFGSLHAYEADKLEKEVIPELVSSIAKGEKFGK